MLDVSCSSKEICLAHPRSAGSVLSLPAEYRGKTNLMTQGFDANNVPLRIH